MDVTLEMEKEEKIGYRDILKQTEYCKLILANIISRFGDSIDALAFTWLVYQVTGSAAWSAIIFAINQLPTVVVQPFAGALVEGMNKKRIMVITDLIRGVIVAGLAVLYLMGNITPWILLAFTLIISSVEAFNLPASMAAIPKIIDQKYYTYGSSLNSTACRVVELIGLGAAGFIIGIFGIQTAIFIDAVTFLGSSLIIGMIRMKEEKPADQEEKTGLQEEMESEEKTEVKNSKKKAKSVDIHGYFENLKGGISYLKKQPVIKNFCFMSIVLNAIMTPINSLQSPLMSEVMGQGSELLSVFGITLSVGMGIGSFCFPFVQKKIAATKCVVGSGIICGICVYSYTLGAYLRENVFAVYALVILVSFLFGLAVSMIMGILSVNFMKVVEPEYLARVGSIFNAGATAATPVASLLVGLFVSYFSTVQILVASSIFCVILFIVTGIRKVQFE